MIYAITILLLSLTASAAPFGIGDSAFLQSGSPLRKGLVGYWRLEEATGTRYDQSQYGNHLTANNSPMNAVGKVDNSVKLVKASLQTLSIPSNAWLAPTGSFTITTWVKLNDVTVTSGGVSKWKSGSAEYIASYFNPAIPGFVFFTYPDGITAKIASRTMVAPATNIWYFVCNWYDASLGTNFISVDNVLGQTTASSTGILASGTNTLFFGGVNGTAEVRDGYMDEIGFWNRTLTDSERSTLYNSGLARRFNAMNTP